MSFFVAINGINISLKTEIITDDLSGECVNKSDIEALASMLAERLFDLPLDSLLIQGLSNTLTLAVLLAAWRIGLPVALIRINTFPTFFTEAVKKLGKHIHIFYDQEKENFFVNTENSTCSFEDWILNTSSKSLPEKPFLWDENNTALIFFTSGSTGIPKGVCHSLPNLLRSTQVFKEHYDITSQDRVVCFAELHTNTGIRSLALSFVSKTSVEFIRRHKGTQSHELMALKNATFMLCGPYMIEVLLRMGNSLRELLDPNLKILSLGSYLPPDIVKLMYERYQISVLNFYGLTETFGFALADKFKNTNDCLPTPCKDVQISLLPIAGEQNLFYLRIHSPNLLLGYLGQALHKQDVFDTGDIVFRQKDGQLKFMGRATGASKSKNGEWIFPLQLEQWLRAQEGIYDAVVKVNPPLATDQLLTVFIVTHRNLAALSDDLTQKITILFGDDYQSIAWHRASIERSIEGKVEKIISYEDLVENTYA